MDAASTQALIVARSIYLWLSRNPLARAQSTRQLLGVLRKRIIGPRKPYGTMVIFDWLYQAVKRLLHTPYFGFQAIEDGQGKNQQCNHKENAVDRNL